MARFTGKIIGYGSIVWLLGLLGGGWVATRAIAPIRDISEAAQRIAGGHLQERIPVAETESELGQLATVLNDTFTRLSTTFDEQARFTSDAAHELRTPVAVILAQTQLALAKPRSMEAHLKTIEMTRRSALRMQELIESLLTLAQTDAPTAMAAQECQLDAISRENLDHIRPLAEARGILLHHDLAPATCCAPPDHITQIVTNLLANAVKYCRPGDSVSLSTQRENGHACLTVADTGPGIAAEHLPHLFERFYRADASRNRVTGGAGLGLAICKTLAEAHGGHISVQSELARGTVFQLRLPAT
jgi:two-component system OmpR family sensor kinase